VSPAARIELATCHAQTHKCLESGTDRATCLQAGHQCVHQALEADFTRLCANLGDLCEACPDSPRCTRLGEKCAAGIPFGDRPAAN
jgi:hypothetical protein